MALVMLGIGRTEEREQFREKFLKIPCDPSLVYYVGGGGIGKTQLIRLLMQDAADADFQVLDIVDMYSTENRYVEGVQSNLIQQLSAERFPTYCSPQGDTPKNFRTDLEKICQDKPVLLPIDTFENVLGNAVARWILGTGEDGLLVPGLVIVIGSRQPVPAYAKNAEFINEYDLSGFSVEEALELYVQKNSFWGLRSIADVPQHLKVFIATLVEKTNGHPLWLEMTYNWLDGDLWTPEAIDQMGNAAFQQVLMARVKEFGEEGILSAHGVRISRGTYQTMVCMAYMRRRFTEELLEKLIALKYVELEQGENHQQIIAALERYFFVKERPGDPTSFQLHDILTEQALLYLWPDFLDDGQGNNRRQEMKRWVIDEYDRMISAAIAEGKNHSVSILRVEQLYYTLETDLEDGRRLFLGLVDLSDPDINRLLPGEITPFLPHFINPDDRFEVYLRLAELEREQGHRVQAQEYWQAALALGKEIGNIDWQISALIGLGELEQNHNPHQALEDYFHPALQLAESSHSALLARVEYEIGLTNRRLQDYHVAIEWYTRAEIHADVDDLRLLGSILNDMGFAHSWAGNLAMAEENVRQALKYRKRVREDLSRQQREITKQLKKLKTQSDTPQRDLQLELARIRIMEDRAVHRVGFSYQALGDIKRFSGEMAEAIRYLEEALKIFESYHLESWQVLCLTSRAEAWRRQAVRYYFEWEEMIRAWQFFENARQDIKQALYLTEKYRILGEFDLVYRRMGRISHDRALVAKKEGELNLAQELLETAQNELYQALKYAENTNDQRERLESLVELAFLVESRFTLELETDSEVLQVELARLDEAIQESKVSSITTFQLGVFEHLAELGWGAYYYVTGQFDDALKYYSTGYVGLAQDIGYGSARFRQHYEALTQKIENIADHDTAIEWCAHFVKAWEDTKLTERHVEMPQWCRRHMRIREHWKQQEILGDRDD